MNDDRTLERAARSFIEAGPTQAPERAVDAAMLRIESTSQERALRIPWRFPTMTLPARLVALAVVGALVLAGVALLGGTSGRKAPATNPPPTSQAVAPASGSAAPATSPSAAPQADHSDVPGRLLVQHLGKALDGSEIDSPDDNFGVRRLYVMNPDGTGVAEFLPGQPSTGKTHADVSSDQTKVVFMDAPSSGEVKIYEANLDGTGFRLISTPCACSELHPAYSPDGTRIVYSYEIADTTTIHVRDLATGDVTTFPGTLAAWPLDATGDKVEHPSWSPDGSTIVYSVITRDKDGNLLSSKLMKLDVASKAVSDVGVEAGLQAGEPRYSPDGSVILFATRSAETSLGQRQGNIFTVRPDGTGLTQITHPPVGSETGEGGTGASWTPDGRYIMYMYGEIRLVEPDGANDALWVASSPSLSTGDRGFGYTTYWIPAAD